MNILATVCARGGSKGVPRKNLRMLGSHSLLEIAIRKALAVKEISDVVVSTDDSEIASKAKKAGAKVPFMRPAELASDTAPKFPVLKHALQECEKAFGKKYDLVVDIDVSVPFTTPEDISSALRMMGGSKPVDTVVAAYVSKHSPYFNMMEEDKEGYISVCKRLGLEIVRRQDAPRVFQLTAGILVLKRKVLLEGSSVYAGRVKPYIMPEERSAMIDSELDFRVAEFMLEKNPGLLWWVGK